MRFLSGTELSLPRLLGQSRVFFSMANDGLLPKLFSEVHLKFHTPYKCNIVLFLFVGLLQDFCSVRVRRHDYSS